MMYVNIIHRPMYKDQSYLDAFKFQQDKAHEYGLKTTILVTFRDLYNEDILNLVKDYHDKYEDEIGLFFGDFECPEFSKHFKTKEYQFWLYSLNDKKKMSDLFFAEFEAKLGLKPKSIGAYYMDAQTLAYMKDTHPEIECSVVSCFEEGSHVYRGTGYGWYLFSEGGPWWPWIPSQSHIHCPAENKDESIDVVALPHLVRDMLFSVFGRDDYYASHPANLLRGKIYKDENLAYDLNFIDQYEAQANYNEGYSYYNMFVKPEWLIARHCYEEDPKVVFHLYEKILKYMAELKKENKLQDMTMLEFSKWYKSNKKYSSLDKCFWRDILGDSDREIFWVCGNKYRATVDLAFGGAITDLRPYAGRMELPTGADTKSLWNGSYPMVLNTYRRAGKGSFGRPCIFNTMLRYKEYNAELSYIRTKARSIADKDNVFEIEPVQVSLGDTMVEIQHIYTFNENEIILETRLLKGPEDGLLSIMHYLSGSAGDTEYPEDIRGVKLSGTGKGASVEIEIKYSSEMKEIENPEKLQAEVPQLKAVIEITPMNKAEKGIISDGCLSGPFYEMALEKKVNQGENIRTCLKIRKR